MPARPLIPALALLLGPVGHASAQQADAAVPPAQTSPDPQAAEATPAEAAATPAAPADLDRLYADFVHYVRIARPALAADAALGLLQADDGSILDAVEASSVPDPTATFERALGMGAPLAEPAATLSRRLETARLARSRDQQRIANNIDRLDRGARGFANGVRRLAAAGQFAAPQLLAVLEDREQADMHPFVLRAMAQVGQPLVQPLMTALPDLAPVPQAQVADVLAEIGYPAPLAAMQEVIESPATNNATRDRVRQAAQRLQASNDRIPAGLTAAELHLLLARGYFDAGTQNQSPIGYDPITDAGILWAYDPRVGLVARQVSGSAYPDALARNHALRALTLNPALSDAFNLFLTADLRADNRLLQDETDFSREGSLREPEFYALIAGPPRLSAVLATALSTNDPALAIDAVDAVAATSATDAVTILAEALTFPDQAVRFRAAEALARSYPQQPFPDDFRVVAALIEAIRPEGSATAAVVAADPDLLNRLSSAAAELQYQPLRAQNLPELQAAMADAPAVDLLITAGDADAVARLVQQAETTTRLATTPVVAFTDPAGQIRLNEALGRTGRFASVVGDVNSDTLQAAAEAVQQRYDAAPGDAPEAQAQTALRLLRELAVRPTALDPTPARPALADLLRGDRPALVEPAAAALAALPDPAAQQALGDAALAADVQQQIPLLDALAESATLHGNLLRPNTVADLGNLAASAEGETAIAAGTVYGALALPADVAVTVLLNDATQ